MYLIITRMQFLFWWRTGRPEATYLEDEALEVEGLKIYASPFTPKFCGAFQPLNAKRPKRPIDRP